jgi:alkylation response protein AidB-like acyl-CoA dehydrogenase
MTNPTPSDPVAAARALAPQIRAHADENEAARRLAPELAEALNAAGLFHMCVPRRFGGGEVTPGVLVRAIETVAESDGSAGWCVMIGATTGVIAAYLPESIAEQVYGGPGRRVSGGVFAPHGTARVDDGVYVVSGQWPFASGCQHCSWLMGGAIIVEDGEPRRLPNGMPDARMLLFPARDVEILDTWAVSGLRGTGSHDIRVTNLRVPVERSVSLALDPPKQEGALYVFPVFGLLAMGIASVSLGIARRAINELTALAAGKTPTGSRRSLAERPLAQMQVAQAEASVRASRALLYDTIDRTWAAVQAEGRISLRQRAMLRLAATHATTSAAAAVDLMYTAGGGTSIYARSALQRCFRDIHVATQHLMVAGPTYELVGRVLLGLETDTAQL